MTKVKASLLMMAVLLIQACASQLPRYAPVVSLQASPHIVFAIEVGDEPLLLSLIQQGVPVNIDTGKESALDLAAAKSMDKAVMAMLIAKADPRLRNTAGKKTALHRYVQRNQRALVRALIAAGADLEATQDDGMTPLAIALANANLPLAKLLIRSGADVNATYADKTLLMHAISQRSTLMMQVLVDAKADQQFVNHDGMTAYSLAETIGNVDATLMLKPYPHAALIAVSK